MVSDLFCIFNTLGALWDFEGAVVAALGRFTRRCRGPPGAGPGSPGGSWDVPVGFWGVKASPGSYQGAS